MNRNPIYFVFGSFASIVDKARIPVTLWALIRCFRLMEFRGIKRTY